MSNIEKAIEIIEDEHDPYMGPIDAPSLVYALNGAGLIADDLPEPSLYAYEDQDRPIWDTVNHFRTDALDAPKVALSKAGNAWKMTPANARALAQALLAAADHADKDNA